MAEPSIRVLFHGDPYRCRKALEERQATLSDRASDIERTALFADEIDWPDLALRLRSTSLFAPTRHFIIRNADALSSPKLLLTALAEDPSDATYVSVVAAPLRATSPLVKGFKPLGRVVALPAPRRRDVAAAVRAMLTERGVSAPAALVQTMIERHGDDLLLHAQEAHKLAIYAQGDAGPSSRPPETLLYSGGERAIWTMLDRMGARDLGAAFEELSRTREDPGWVMNAAIRHLSRLVMIRTLLDERAPRDSLSSITGIPVWLLRRLQSQADRWRADEIRRALDRALQLDISVKKGERRVEDAVIELFLATSPRTGA
jgi:DNA polymerase III delta subunit